jgi:hypothetical protein
MEKQRKKPLRLGDIVLNICIAANSGIGIMHFIKGSYMNINNLEDPSVYYKRCLLNFSVALFCNYFVGMREKMYKRDIEFKK